MHLATGFGASARVIFQKEYGWGSEEQRQQSKAIAKTINRDEQANTNPSSNFGGVSDTVVKTYEQVFKTD